MKIQRRSFIKAVTMAPIFSKGFQMMAAEGRQRQQIHHRQRAKRVIFLNMRGAPSHMDTFDYKPELVKRSGQIDSLGSELLGPVKKFSQSGQSGLWISDLFPNIQKCADDMCLLRGMNSSQPNHPQAQTELHTGNAQFPRPSLGSWIMYGVGSENKNIPGFVTLSPGAGTTNHFSSGFLPIEFQGTMVGKASRGRSRSTGDTQLPDIENKYISQELQRHQLDFIQSLNKDKLKRDRYNPKVEGLGDSLELAFRMQSSMPDIMDYEKEKSWIKKMYGLENNTTKSFGTQLLMARRFIESGARFVTVSHGSWDHHFNLSTQLPARASEIDLPIAGLLKDLKQRGLLKDTLVIWAGEFGRTPGIQGSDGRGHNNKGYTAWLAGGGVKGGFSYGATDEFGYEAVDGRMSTHDFHATILHMLGIDHEKLTYNYAGRDFRLTDVYGDVAKEIFN